MSRRRGRTALAISTRRVGAAGLVLGLCFGAFSTTPASASLLGLDTLVGSLLHGEGGIFGHEGGVIAGDDQLSDVLGFDAEGGEVVGGGMEVVGAVEDVLGDPNIGGEGSFGDTVVGRGPLVGGGIGGVLGGLLSNGVGLLGGVL
jgi:hypothetical protein